MFNFFRLKKSSQSRFAMEEVTGEYFGDGSKNRYVLSETITDIAEGAISNSYRGEFWCVRDSYAAERMAAMCPESKLVLFASQDELKQTWKNRKTLTADMKEAGKALAEKDIYTLMNKTGWTYEDAVCRAEAEFRKSGKTAKEYAKGDWRAWFRKHPDGVPEASHIAWRKAEVDRLDQAIATGTMPVSPDTFRPLPRSIHARKYLAEKKIGAEIVSRQIRIQTLCDYLDVTIPANLASLADKTFSSIAFNPKDITGDSVFFCWRDKGVKPKVAKKAGAVCAFGAGKYQKEFEKEKVPYIACNNLEIRQAELAGLWRRQFPQAKSVCITGSIGKTTTTEMINHVAMSSFKSICIWTNKNLPNQAARFLQALDEETGVYVQEASGASVSLMEKTSRIVNPDIFVITNVGSGHIGKHGGNRTSLLYEKITCDRTAPENALGVVNYDDELLRKVPFCHEIAWFSLKDPEADYHAENIVEEDGLIRFEVVEKNGQTTPVVIHAIGLHNVYDALSAFAVGVRLGIERSVISAAIGAYRSAGVRQNLVEIAGRRVFLDCYSATEDSMRTALESARSFHLNEGGRRIVVLGDIPDLDARSAEIHRSVGKMIHDSTAVDQVIFYGAMMEDAMKEAEGGQIQVRHTTSRRELESWLSQTSRDDVVIFKASHKMELHRVADDWLGTTFNLDDLREPVCGRPTVKQVNYTNVENYGACATELSSPRKNLVIASEAGGMPVRLIMAKAFEGSAIETLTIKDSLISIGKDAFSGCRNLAEVKLPDTLYYIGVGAFRNCQDLEAVYIPEGCATIDAQAFAGCSGLAYIQIPASVLSIGEGAFDGDSDMIVQCPENSYAAKVIPQMCPGVKLKLTPAVEEDGCLPMPDMSVFAPEDKVYTADSNIDSAVSGKPKEKKEKPEEKEKALAETKIARPVQEKIILPKPSLPGRKPEKRPAFLKEEDHRGEIHGDALVQKVTISSVGDCTFGRNHKMSEKDSWDQLFDEKGPEYFLSGVAPVFEASDIAIANLEGVLSDKPERQIDFYRQRADRVDPKKYCHLGRTEYIDAMVKGKVDVVTFANNHNMDYGVEGYVDTLNACRSRNLPIAHYDQVVRYKVGDIQVGIVSLDFSYLSDKIGEGHMIRAIADLRQDCQLIVACIHWGQNYKEKAAKSQRRLGHLCIDLGADVVFGGHAHILQGIERYKGRYIFYSMGNFCYGGRAVPKDNDTMIAQQTFTFVDGRLHVDDAVKVIPCWMSGKTEINDFRPVIKTGAEGQAIIDKINDRSESYGMKLDSEGRPLVDKAGDLRDKVPNTPYSQDVPPIVYTLTDVYPE